MTIPNSAERQAPPIRVAIINITGVVAEILTKFIRQQPDMVMVDNTAVPGNVPPTLGERTDVMVIGAPYLYPPPAICDSLWRSFPLLKVLVLMPSGDTGMVYWLNVRQHRLNTVSARSVVSRIRHIHRRGLIVD